MTHRLLPSLLVLLGLFLSGCGLSPQQLNPNPELNAPLSAVGHGQPVQVTVVDGRSSPVLGTRGGMYPETSNISVPAANVLPKLQAQAEAALRLLGFTPSASAFNAPHLTLTLVDLKYQSPKDSFYVTEADISATLGVEVQNGPSRYNGRYRAAKNQRFGMAPNEESNTQLVNEVLSDALTRAFSDPSIGQKLAQ